MSFIEPNPEKAKSFKAKSDRPFIKKDELIWVIEDKNDFLKGEPKIFIAMEEVKILSRQTIFSAWSINQKDLIAQEVRVHFSIDYYSSSWLEETLEKKQIGPAIRLIAFISGWEQGKKNKHVYLHGLIVEDLYL